LGGAPVIELAWVILDIAKGSAARRVPGAGEDFKCRPAHPVALRIISFKRPLVDFAAIGRQNAHERVRRMM
jgi:hypothetical protein